MKFRNLKIGTQLIIGFAFMVLFVALISVATYKINNQLFQQTEMIYNHPLKIRRTIMFLESDVLRIQVWTRDLLLVKTERERGIAVQRLKVAETDIEEQFDVLGTIYLGSPEDISAAKNAYTRFQSSVDDLVNQVVSGTVGEVSNNILNTGNIGETRKQLMTCMGTIDTNSKNTADAMYLASVESFRNLKYQQLILLFSIIILSIVIYYLILRSIGKPLLELTQAAQNFHNGNLNARSSFKAGNEIGLLSKTFNMLAENLQKKIILDEKVSELSRLMLSEYGVKKFFQSTLSVLMEYTGSQMAAVYLLSEYKQSYDHFESIGLNEHAKKSFDATNFDGEFGSVLAARTRIHTREIPADSRFIYISISGEIIPRDVITLPVVAAGEIIAIISLASIAGYTEDSLLFIDTVNSTLCARIEGVLAFRRTKEYSERMEYQNRELEAQKMQLANQSEQLTEQNLELEMQKSQLSEVSKLKTSFLSNMSHELRTPLNSVIALSGVLNRRLAGKIDAEEYNYIEVIERNGKQLLTLINDILDISRIEAGRVEVNISEFNIHDLLQEVVTMIYPQAEQKGIGLMLAGGGRKITMSSDPDKIRHIMQNLVGNAVKFTEKGQVEVVVRLVNGMAEIKVKDTGIGISDDHVLHIFDEFRQADSGTSRRFGGTGLGLAIVKKFTGLLGGSISVSSQEGKGSEFNLILPIVYTGTADTSENDTEKVKITHPLEFTGEIKTGTGKTVLLVDDSEAALMQMTYILKESGYEVLSARDGNEALEIISRIIPDAIVLDLMMPRIDGFEVLATIRAAVQTAHIPVLILTARQITKEELRFLKRNNVHQLIQKGLVKREELLKTISEMVKTEPVLSTVKTSKKIEGEPVILVVEDNYDNMVTVKALLADKYKILEAVDGSDAIIMARKHKPDLVLMDIGLPGIDGFEAFRIIRNDDQLKHIPIVALTASALVSDKEAILKYGFDGFFPKPIDEPKFLTMINEILHGKQDH